MRALNLELFDISVREPIDGIGLASKQNCVPHNSKSEWERRLMSRIHSVKEVILTSIFWLSFHSHHYFELGIYFQLPYSTNVNESISRPKFT